MSDIFQKNDTFMRDVEPDQFKDHKSNQHFQTHETAHTIAPPNTQPSIIQPPEPTHAIPEKDQIDQLSLNDKNYAELQQIVNLSMLPFATPMNYSMKDTFENRASKLEDLLGI